MWAVFAEDEWSITKDLTATLGGRYNRHDAFGGEFSPRAYLVWNGTPHLTVKGGVSGGFRAPRLNQLIDGVSGITGQGTVISIGNPTLKPETSTSAELGLSYDTLRGVSTSVTLFHNRIKDRISDGGDCTVQWISSCAANPTATYAINIDEGRTLGLELSNRTQLSERLALNLGYTWTDSEAVINGVRSGKLSDTAEHLASAQLRFDPDERGNLWLRGEYRGKSRRFDGDPDQLTGDSLREYQALGSQALAQAAPQPVTVYSSRIEQLLKPTLDRYTKETGVPVRLLTDRGGSLAERLASEGVSSPADVLITVDMGNLWSAAERGLLRKIASPVLDANVPANFRDPGSRWWGLSQRERTIFHAAGCVDPKDLSTYEDLALPKWKGKLCLRTSKQTYTQSLVAMMIAKHGEARAEEIARGWVANLATDVFTNDNALLKAIEAGQCDVGIANTYYYGRILSKEPGFGDKVKLFWANQGAGQGGAHVNLSGAGVTAHAPNPEGARKLLEWLSTQTVQTAYTHGTFESSINAKADADPIVKAWGRFTPSPLNAADIGAHQPAAIRLLDRVGYR